MILARATTEAEQAAFLMTLMSECVADGCVRVRLAQDPMLSHAMAQNAYSLLCRLA